MRAKIGLAAALALAAPAGAQIALPTGGLPGSLPGVDLPAIGERLGRSADNVLESSARSARELLRARERTLARFLRRNENAVEADVTGAPARRGELLVLDLAPGDLPALERAGFTLIAREPIASLGLDLARLAVPRGMDLAGAQQRLGELLPEAQIAPDNIHFRSGNAAGVAALTGAAASAAASTTVPVGMIDGAPSALVGRHTVRGFAEGAPLASDHGSAIAHLLAHAGARDIRAADVYGNDPAGGGALAIARALGWLVEGGSKVISISLVGPRNALVERAIAAAQAKGAVVVAAVGNDGPAAPPAYPASYRGVVAVTGVDGRKRALIEAGRAAHLDYAAPGADIAGRNKEGRRVSLRGTSFATPLVAARLAHALGRGGNWRARLDDEAEDLGARGTDPVFGRGLLCGACRGE